MKRIFPLILIVSIASVLTLSSYVHVFARHSRLSSDTQDMMIHLSFKEDYVTYLSLITQGQSSRLLYEDPFLMEEKVAFTHTIYLLAGLISRPFNFSSPIVYHFLKIISGFIFIFSIYYFGASIYHKQFHKYLYLLLLVFFPIVDLGSKLDNVANSFMPWWKGFGIIARFDLRPHHSFALSGLLFLVGYYLRSRNNLNIKKTIIITIMAVITAIMVPYTIIPFVFILFIDLINFINKMNLISFIKAVILPRVIIFTFIFGVLFLMKLSMNMIAQGGVFATEEQWSIQFWQRDPYFFFHLYSSFLLLLVFAIPGLFTIFRKHKSIYLLVIAWIILPLLLGPWINIHHISWGRMLHFYVQFPLGILALNGIIYLLSKNKYLGMLLFITIITIGFFSARLELINQIQLINDEPFSREYYPRKMTFQLIDFVKSNLPPFAKVLTGYETALMINSFYPMKSYVGLPNFGPYNFDTTSVDKLLTEKLSLDEAKDLLNRYNIKYIIDDPQHMELREWNRISLPYLESIWINEGYQIFSLKE